VFLRLSQSKQGLSIGNPAFTATATWLIYKYGRELDLQLPDRTDYAASNQQYRLENLHHFRHIEYALAADHLSVFPRDQRSDITAWVLIQMLIEPQVFSLKMSIGCSPVRTRR
jgi:hypothetical protein